MSVGFLKSRVSTKSLTLLGGLCLAAAGAAQPRASAEAPTRVDTPLLRMAVSDTVVSGVSLSDASAAMAVWSAELLTRIDVKMVFAPRQDWVMPSDQLLAAIRGGTVDLFCLTVQEYRQVALYVDTDRVITDDYGGDELLLVVRDGGGIVNLAGLRGRSLIVQESPSTSLAEPWLSVLLWREGLESPERFLGHMTTNTKLSQVVLPVFFGRADACVVTRRGLETMTELNPQLGQKLKVLLASPKMESAFFACRKGFSGQLRNTIFQGLVGLKLSATARQVTLLFQSPGFTTHDAECLLPAQALLDAYDRHREPPAGRKRQ